MHVVLSEQNIRQLRGKSVVPRVSALGRPRLPHKVASSETLATAELPSMRVSIVLMDQRGLALVVVVQFS